MDNTHDNEREHQHPRHEDPHHEMTASLAWHREQPRHEDTSKEGNHTRHTPHPHFQTAAILKSARTHTMFIILLGTLIGSFMMSNHISYYGRTPVHVASASGDTGSRETVANEVSRDSFRTPIDDNTSWGGLGSMSVPYSQSSNEKTARSDLKNTVDHGNDVYNTSAGKVQDDKTRQNLQSKVNAATQVLNGIKDSTQIDTKQLAGLVNDINNAVNAVNDSMAKKSQAAATGQGASSSGAVAATGDIQQYALQSFGKYGWDSGQWDSLSFIVGRESGWNPNAVNASSGARGLFQCLGHAECSSSSYINDYHAQVDWGLNYISSRYGSPNSAAAFWRAHNWY